MLPLGKCSGWIRITHFVAAVARNVRMLLILYQSCAPNTDHGLIFRKSWLNIHTGRRWEIARFVGSQSYLFANATRVGSKTCIGLTYLELDLVNVPWLLGVSGARL